ncbi:TPA: DNA cytosine methyltransferase [Campylobacter jejuni]|nr:DNA cytosine methyltransferase [Campylobacter jejuni]
MCNLFNINCKQDNHFNYKWFLKDGFPQSKDDFIKKNDYRVFGTFISGGGSSLGYKLAGFNHLGGVEYNKKIADMYKENLNPKYLFIEDIREFNKRDYLPKELYNLDILDGSPPCTTFSTSGLREKVFGVKKKFSEGGKEQTLDDLVFVYADNILKLKPKVFLFENVKGLLFSYSKNHLTKFENIVTKEYTIFKFLLNGMDMGLPQSRERCFIIGVNKKYNIDFFNLNYKEKHISFEDVIDHSDQECNLTSYALELWNNAKCGEPVGKFKTRKKLFLHKPSFTLTCRELYHSLYPRKLNKKEKLLLSSLPLDYKFNTKGQVNFLTGMCVPPLMIANIAYQIKIQILDKIYGKQKK